MNPKAPKGTPIAPIETHYAGCRFRSRLEARWAVFFNHLSIDWMYEPEGYVLGNGNAYLPDFLIYPNSHRAFWFEVKGTFPTRREVRNAESLAEGTGLKAYVYYGRLEAPSPHLTNADLRAEPSVPAARWYDRPGWEVSNLHPWEFNAEPTAFICTPEGDGQWVGDLGAYFHWWTECPHCSEITLKGRGVVGHCTLAKGYDHSFGHNTPRLLEAYRAARSARFEHGEKG